MQFIITNYIRDLVLLGENKYKTQENLTNNNFIIERRTASSSMIQNRTREKNGFCLGKIYFFTTDEKATMQQHQTSSYITIASSLMRAPRGWRFFYHRLAK
jgi:hypothetical protein